MRYRRRRTHDEENAWIHWQHANTLEALEFEDEIWDFLDDPTAFLNGAVPEKVKALLDANSKTLEAIDTGIVIKQFQFPKFLIDDFKIDWIQCFRNANRLKSIRARSLLRSKQEEQAVEEIFSNLDFAHLVLAGEGLFIHHLIGLALCNLSFGDMRLLARSTKNGQLLQKLLDELEERLDSRKFLVQSLKIESCYYSVPLIAKIPANRGLEPILDYILEFSWFGSQGGKTGLVARKKSLQALFEGHPNLFDPAETVQLVTDRTANGFRTLKP